MSLNNQQQQEFQKYQQLAQQLGQAQQQFIQLQGREQEIQRTLDAIKDFDDDAEVYQHVGQILFKTTAGSTRGKLNEELELLEVRVKRAKSQLEDIETKIKESEQKLRSAIS